VEHMAAGGEEGKLMQDMSKRLAGDKMDLVGEKAKQDVVGKEKGKEDAGVLTDMKAKQDAAAPLQHRAMLHTHENGGIKDAGDGKALEKESTEPAGEQLLKEDKPAERLSPQLSQNMNQANGKERDLLKDARMDVDANKEGEMKEKGGEIPSSTVSPGGVKRPLDEATGTATEKDMASPSKKPRKD